ncbi:UNVERIFIED_CONTAM: hypothetical protein HHA_246590 [Hammondia hammondi]|eukprot:XP_008883719.1 hypothetical protein HHA_246590 [Hammondia hammondi]
MAGTADGRRFRVYPHPRVPNPLRLVPPYAVDDAYCVPPVRYPAFSDTPRFRKPDSNPHSGHDAPADSPVLGSPLSCGHALPREYPEWDEHSFPFRRHQHPASPCQCLECSSLDGRLAPHASVDGRAWPVQEDTGPGLVPRSTTSRTSQIRGIQDHVGSLQRSSVFSEDGQDILVNMDAESSRTHPPESVYTTDYVDHFAAPVGPEETPFEEPQTSFSPTRKFSLREVSRLAPLREQNCGIPSGCDLPYNHACSIAQTERYLNRFDTTGTGHCSGCRGPSQNPAHACAVCAPHARETIGSCFCSSCWRCGRNQIHVCPEHCSHVCGVSRRGAPTRVVAHYPHCGTTANTPVPKIPRKPYWTAETAADDGVFSGHSRSRSTDTGDPEWQNRKADKTVARTSCRNKCLTPTASGLASLNPKDYKYLPLWELQLVPPAGIPTTKFQPVTRT